MMRSAAVAALFLVAACGDLPNAPTLRRVHDATAFDTDPHVGAPGLWVAGTTPGTCFADLNASVADYDADWLDDGCEQRLAEAFSPYLQRSAMEECGWGEPAYAVKYFNATRRVRIAYMLAYYEDCGSLGHWGDSEMIMLEIVFHPYSQHWNLRQMWLSSHYLTGGDRSRWVDPSTTEFPLIYGNTYAGFPKVYVARNKHANYATESRCNHAGPFDPGVVADECWPGGFAFRYPMPAARNAGSRHVNRLGCVPSQDPERAQWGTSECFYGTPVRFYGWYPRVEMMDGSTPYANLLNSDKFEAAEGDWGPGPQPPGYVPPPQISGPTVLEGTQAGTWTFASQSGNCTWLTDGVVRQMGSCSFTFNWTDAPSVHYIDVTPDINPDGAGVVASLTVNVNVEGGGPNYSRFPSRQPARPPSTRMRVPSRAP